MFVRLRETRKNKGLSQRQMAELLHITRQGYAKYEQDKKPSWEITLEITKILGVSADYLFGLTDNPLPVEGISTQEKKLIDTFRLLDTEGQGLVQAVLQEAAKYPADPDPAQNG